MSPSGPSREALGGGKARYGAESRDRPRLRAEHRGLRRQEELAADGARGLRRGMLHGRAPVGWTWPAGLDPRQARTHHGTRQGGAVSARPREPAVPRVGAECVVGLDFTYVSTSTGIVYVAFVNDVYACRTVSGG